MNERYQANDHRSSSHSDHLDHKVREDERYIERSREHSLGESRHKSQEQLDRESRHISQERSDGDSHYKDSERIDNPRISSAREHSLESEPERRVV